VWVSLGNAMKAKQSKAMLTQPHSTTTNHAHHAGLQGRTTHSLAKYALQCLHLSQPCIPHGPPAPPTGMLSITTSLTHHTPHSHGVTPHTPTFSTHRTPHARIHIRTHKHHLPCPQPVSRTVASSGLAHDTVQRRSLPCPHHQGSCLPT
jgi:hypothetical protein